MTVTGHHHDSDDESESVIFNSRNALALSFTGKLKVELELEVFYYTKCQSPHIGFKFVYMELAATTNSILRSAATP
jgi:hypothetical protein